METSVILTLCSLLVIILCLVLHCTEHFRCRFCIKYKYRISSFPQFNNNGYSRSRPFNKQSSVTATNTNTTINTYRRSTNNSIQIGNATPVSINNQHLRVSNSTNTGNTSSPSPHSRTRQQKNSRHHETNSSLFGIFESSFNASHPDGYKVIKRKCQCCLVGAEEDFDFFPLAFLLYIVFATLLVIAVLARYVLLHHVYYNEDSMYLLQMTNAHNLNAWTLRDVWKQHEVAHTSRFHTSAYFDYYGSYDWILLYCIMIMLVWESLFNFYRFYTTMHAAKYFYTIETKQVFKKYAIYTCVFAVFYLCTIHCYYWLYPITVLLHLAFNVYCTWMFAHILVVQYKHIISTDSFMTDVHDAMLSSVYLMRKFSMFSSVVSSMYLALLLFAYDTSIIIYLPIVWSLCAISITLNFVRNRQFITKQLYRIQHCLIIKNFSIASSTKELKEKVFKQSNRRKPYNTESTSSIPKKLQSATENGKISDLKRQRNHSHKQSHKDILHNGHLLKLRNDSTASNTINNAELTLTNTGNHHHHLGVAGVSSSNLLTDISVNTMNGTASVMEHTLPTLRERAGCGLHTKRISMISEISNDTMDEEMANTEVRDIDHDELADQEEEEQELDDEEKQANMQEDEENNNDAMHVLDDDEMDDEVATHSMNRAITNGIFATPSSRIAMSKHVTDSPLSMNQHAEILYALNKKNRERTRLHKISITAPSAMEMGMNMNGGNTATASTAPSTATGNNQQCSFMALKRKTMMIPNPIRTRSATLNTPSQQTVAAEIEKQGSFSEHSSASNLMGAHSDHEENGFITSPDTNAQYVCHGKFKTNGNYTSNTNALCLPLKKTRSDNHIGNEVSNNSLNSPNSCYLSTPTQDAMVAPHGYAQQRNMAKSSRTFRPFQSIQSQPNIQKRPPPKTVRIASYTHSYGANKSPGISPLTMPMTFNMKSCGHSPQKNEASMMGLWQSMSMLNKRNRNKIQQASVPPIDLTIDTNTNPLVSSRRVGRKRARTHTQTRHNTQDEEDDDIYDGDHDEEDEYESIHSQHEQDTSPTFNLVTEIATSIHERHGSKPRTPSRKKKALQLLGISSNGPSTPSNFNHSASYNHSSLSRRNQMKKHHPSLSKSSNKSKSLRFMRKTRGALSLRNRLSKSNSTKNSAPPHRQQQHEQSEETDGFQTKPPLARPSTARITPRNTIKPKHSNARKLPLTPKFSSNKKRQQPILVHSNSQHAALITNNTVSKSKPCKPGHGNSSILHKMSSTQSTGHTPQSLDRSPIGVNPVSRSWFFEYKTSKRAKSPQSLQHNSLNARAPIASPIIPQNPSANSLIPHNNALPKTSQSSPNQENLAMTTPNSFQRGYSGNTCTPKSFSKTLTQSELRDIMYEEKDVAFQSPQPQQISDQNQQQQRQQHTPQQQSQSKNGITPNSDMENSPFGVSSMLDLFIAKHTYSNSDSVRSKPANNSNNGNSTVFVSSSYHRDNVVNTQQPNRRIFELLAANQTCGTLESSEVLYDDFEPEDTPRDQSSVDVDAMSNLRSSTQLQASSVPPKLGTRQLNGGQNTLENMLDLRKAFSLPNEQTTEPAMMKSLTCSQHNDSRLHINYQDSMDEESSKPEFTHKQHTNGTLSTTKEINIHYACNDIDDQDSRDDDHYRHVHGEAEESETARSRLKLIGIPSNADDVIVDINKLQQANRRMAGNKHKSRSQSKSKSMQNASLTDNKLILPDLESTDDDDVTLNTEMLILDSRATPSINPSHVHDQHLRNDTNITVTYHDHANDCSLNTHNEESNKHVLIENDLMQQIQHIANASSGDDEEMKGSEDDYFPAPPQLFHPRTAAKSLFDVNSKKQSFSFSSRKIPRDSLHKRRSRSMPSIDAMEECFESVANPQQEEEEDGEEEEEERGDIVSLLSVLVKHGFYTQTNLNSVQQLTSYNAKQ